MNSPKVKTQNNVRNRIKNISSLIAMLLAMVTIFQASAVKPVNSEKMITELELKMLAETESCFTEKEMGLEEFIIDEVESKIIEEVKVFDAKGELVASGELEGNEKLRELVNQANYLSSFGDKKYYQLAN